MLKTMTVSAKIALIFTGTMIGAGFASGQELLYFFITYGSMGLSGIAIAGLAFAWFGWRIALLNSHFKEETAAGFLQRLCGKNIGIFFSWLLWLFLFTILVLMLAGAGTIAEKRLGLPFFSGTLLFAAVLYPASLKGFRTITAVNTLTAPLLSLIILTVCLHSLSYHAPSPDFFYSAARHANQPAPHWMIACLLYVSYNITLGLAVLVPLSRKKATQLQAACGYLSGGFLLALLAFAIALTVFVHCPAILETEIPMLDVSCSQSHLHAWLYTIVFYLAMYTTSLTCLYGCFTAISKKTNISASFGNLFLLSFALLFTQFSFSQIIRTFFPLFGYACFWILFKLTMKR